MYVHVCVAVFYHASDGDFFVASRFAVLLLCHHEKTIERRNEILLNLVLSFFYLCCRAIMTKRLKEIKGRQNE